MTLLGSIYLGQIFLPLNFHAEENQVRIETDFRYVDILLDVHNFFIKKVGLVQFGLTVSKGDGPEPDSLTIVWSWAPISICHFVASRTLQLCLLIETSVFFLDLYLVKDIVVCGEGG